MIKTRSALSILIFFLSCSPGIKDSGRTESQLFFPSPPDTARIQYLTTFSTSQDITGQRSPFLTYVMGEEPQKVIQKPYGLALWQGRIYICDSMLPGLEIIDLKNQSFDIFTPDGPGQLKKPLNCTIGPSGNLYVADVQRRQVVVFGQQGNFIYSIGDGKTGKPTDIAIYDDKIWICDYDLHKIIVYNKHTRSKLFSFPDVDKNDPALLFGPTNISIKNNEVYITDTGAAVIKKFSTDGRFLGSIGSRGNNPGQFIRPKGIAIDNDNNSFVVDAAFENVQIFNPHGNLLMYFGGPYKKPGYMWLPAAVVIDYDNLDYFKNYVHTYFDLKYLIFVSNQYGPDKINVYGFIKPKGS